MREAGVMLIVKDGLILGVSRRNNKTKFGLPGGKLEPGETPLQAACREAFEETGVKVDDAVFIYRRDELPESPDGEAFHTYCFFATNWSGEPHNSEEGEVKWLTAADLTGDAGAFAEYNTKTLQVLKEKVGSIYLQ